MSSADRRGILAAESWLQTWPQRYGFAVLAAMTATLLRYLLQLTVGSLPPFVIFLPAIIVVALFAGFWPGLLSTVLSAGAVAAFFWTSLGVFGVNRTREVLGLVFFCGIGAGISALAQRYRRHEGRLREFERVVEGLEEMIVVVDRNYRYLIANRAFLNYRGMKPEDVIGRPAGDVLNPSIFQSTIKPKLDECFEGKIVRFEMRYTYPALGERDLVVTYFPIEGRDGVDRVASVFQDVTEQKKADISLRLFRTLMDQSNDAVEVVDPETLRFLDVNQKSCEELGYTREELLSLSVFDIDPNVDEPKRVASLEKLKQAGRLVMETTHRRKDGRTFPVEISLKYAQLDRDYVVTVSRDITERRAAEAAWRESEDRYRDLVEHSEDLVCTHNLAGQLLTVNPAPARVLGYEVSELLKIPMRNLVAPEFHEQFDAYLNRIRTNGADKGLLCIVTRSGERRIWEYNNTLRTEGVPEPVVRGIAHDITERKQAQAALRASEQRYRTLFEENIAGVALSSSDGIVLDCNKAWAHLLGYDSAEEIRGRQTREFYFDVAERDSILAELQEKKSFLGREMQLRRKDGAGVWVLFDCLVRKSDDGPIIIQVTAIDITERKQAEAQLRKSEERFRVALKDSPITVFNQDRDLRYTWIYNPQLYWQHEALGKTDDEILGPKAAAAITGLKRRVLETGIAVREEVAIPQNGRKYVFDMTIEPLFDPDQNVAGITGSCMDIARLRERADRLQEAKELLAEQKSYLESEIQTELGFETIIGQSATLRDVLKKARIVAPTDSTVLLLGETGTGKELVARSVHALSPRREQNFIKLNCAAVPSGLLESELFGHEKGAFTGAVNKKIGRVELADKGTLFLDEIGELPSELQPKLLRVLQDREFERLGGVQTLHVDVRIVAATNRDLRQDIGEKKFREDLFYRLNVFPIELPPLRERRDDIPALVEHFVDKHARRMGKRIDSIPENTMQLLRDCSWPGNVRELENMVERMVILSKGRELAPPPSELEHPDEANEDHLTEIERDHIIRVLRETNGVLSGNDGAASRLGIKRTTLQSMMRRLGIEAQEYRRGTGTFGRP